MILSERLDQIEDIIINKKFLKNINAVNDPPYYVFDYPASNELDVREYVKCIVEKNTIKDGNKFLLEINLYDLIIEILKREDFWDAALEAEKDMGFYEVSNYIMKTLGVDGDSNNWVVDEIGKRMEAYQVVFLTGLGNAFPIIRSHEIIENMSQKYTQKPFVLFFPGEYTGLDFRLFGMEPDDNDNHYRARKLV